ncbi:hypothetical protein B0T14DRAFT_537986 [Immersiella caudata]|uniref:AAA+ ATPase lid domain-containing protein n=1 Tax=Immersiella caudata TaxID=314043 RepID=A0AA40C100_9PEZI|nr:hypothetical protein B0T14DRAFT_537986 [Immersiella caudata]
MTQRNSAELQRNAIVAVFLRMIEYYQGMLFLTTNRLAEFDPAFFNRVHITIKYGNLGPDERRNIWRQHVQRACRRSRKPYLWNEDAYRLLGSIETNGREIRNLTRTAVGFAQSMDQDLDITHVVAVIRNNLGEMGNQDLGGIFAELKAVHERLLEERPPEIIVEALPPS